MTRSLSHDRPARKRYFSLPQSGHESTNAHGHISSAETAGGRRSGSVSKRDNLQYSLGGGGGVIAFIFRPGGLNRTICPVTIAENMTIKRRTTGFGLKRLGDGVAASVLQGDVCRIFGRGGG